MSAAPDYVWYGDDFTGATDTLATISERGGRAFLFLGIPAPEQLDQVGPLDALGIAGATRSMTSRAMRDTLSEVGRYFARSGAAILHYKCCSTFDSAPETGNLVTAMETLAPFTAGGAVPVIGGQPSLGRYCAFANVFARHGDTTYRLDRHPIMRAHPATPMGEADLARHFTALGTGSVRTIPWTELEDPEADTPLAAFAHPGAVILDALSPEHVTRIGALLRKMPAPLLAIGASSVAEAWFPPADVAAPPAQDSRGGPVLALAGSLSETTRQQVAAARSYDILPMNGAPPEETASRATAALAAGRNVLISTRGDTDLPGPADRTLAARCGTLVADILARSPVRRLAIAGGDTSSHVVQALDIWGLAYDRRLGRGICICRTRSRRPDRDGMEILLKGGQLGAVTLFDDFAGAMEVAR